MPRSSHVSPFRLRAMLSKKAMCLASQSCLQYIAETAWAIFAHVQVSFFRSNLMLRVVPKPTGKSSEGNPADLEALVNYIR